MSIKSILKVANYYNVKYGFDRTAILNKVAMPTLTEEETFDMFSLEDQEEIKRNFDNFVSEFERLKAEDELDSLKSMDCTHGGGSCYDLLEKFTTFGSVIRKQPHGIGNRHFAIMELLNKLELAPNYSKLRNMARSLSIINKIVRRRYLKWHHSVGPGAQQRAEREGHQDFRRKQDSIREQLESDRIRTLSLRPRQTSFSLRDELPSGWVPSQNKDTIVTMEGTTLYPVYQPATGTRAYFDVDLGMIVNEEDALLNLET